jgi:hypothetical protein
MRLYVCRHILKQMLFAFGLFLLAVAFAEAAQTTASSPEPVPNWLAWKVVPRKPCLL